MLGFRKFGSLLVLSLFLPLAVACAVAPEPEAAPAPAPAKPGERPVWMPSPDAKPVYGGKFVYGQETVFRHVDPHMERSGAYLTPAGLAYAGLLRWKFGDQYVGSEPYLAESWEMAKDGLSATFKLRRGVKFHNLPPVNGREVTAEDVVFSFDRLRLGGAPYYNQDPRFQLQDRFREVSKVEAVDKYTVKFTFSQPSVAFEHWMGSPASAIVPKELVAEEKGNINMQRAIGAGPFILVENKPNISLKYKKNPDYFLPGRPYFDEYEYVIIRDFKTRVAAFLSGQIDHPDKRLGPQEAKTVQESYPKLMMQRGPFSTVPGFRLNTRKAPLNDVRVRRALHLAFDRHEAIEKVEDGSGRPNHFVNWGMADWTYSQEELLKMPGYRQPKDQDIAEAKRLLKEAGFESGLKLEVICPIRGTFCEMGVVFQQQLRKIGVDLTVTKLDDDIVDQRLLNGDFQLNAQGITSGSAEPDSTVKTYATGSAENYFGYSNPRVDELVAKQARTFDKAERRKLLLEIQDNLMRDLPALPGYSVFFYVGHPKGCYYTTVEPKVGELGNWWGEAWCEAGTQPHLR